MNELERRVEKLEEGLGKPQPQPAGADVVLRSARILDAELGPRGFRIHVESYPIEGVESAWRLYEESRAGAFVRIFGLWYYRWFDAEWQPWEEAIEELLASLASAEPGFTPAILKEALRTASPGEEWPPTVEPTFYRESEREAYQLEGDVVVLGQSKGEREQTNKLARINSRGAK